MKLHSIGNNQPNIQQRQSFQGLKIPCTKKNLCAMWGEISKDFPQISPIFAKTESGETYFLIPKLNYLFTREKSFLKKLSIVFEDVTAISRKNAKPDIKRFDKSDVWESLDKLLEGRTSNLDGITYGKEL